MTPEKKSESIVNLPPKIKKAIAGGIVAASLVTGCNVAVEALPHEKPIITSTSVPTKDPETNADPTQATYELTPTQKATDTMINPPTLTPEPTMTLTTEVGLSVENVPADLNFIDGRNVKDMVSSVGIDANTGLEVAINNEGNIVAYNLKTESKDLWVVNPLLEKGFRWNFDTNENGQFILHNSLEEDNYKPFPIEGMKYVKPDELPVTFWDESHPAKEDEKYPWPSEGTLAVFDGDGDVLMYYSKYENAWWYAGYQIELPGNMVFRQSSMSLALTGVRYKEVDEDIWPGQDLNVVWQEIRNHIDWLAYTHRTGDFISFENFSSRVSNGEVFEYQSWIFDLATKEYKLTTLNNKTKMYFVTSIKKNGFGNSYDSLYNAQFHGVGLDYSSGVQLNPDNSISIINWRFDDAISRLKLKNRLLLGQGINPFCSYTIDFLAANDKHQKEGFAPGPADGDIFFSISPLELINRQLDRLSFLHLSNPPLEGVEFELSQYTPIIYPNIDNPHPYQKP